MRTQQRITVLGAGGRAGSAITRRVLGEGHRVTALVRSVARHPWLEGSGATLVEGDATDPADVARAVTDADAVINAVTPFSAPPASFDGFDESFYERVIGAILAGIRSGAVRIVTVGLSADLRLPDGRVVADDPELFPPALRPFARAHARERLALEAASSTPDWLIVVPPAGLSAEARSDGYVLAEPVFSDAALSYDSLAAAVADEAVRPTRRGSALVLPRTQG